MELIRWLGNIGVSGSTHEEAVLSRFNVKP
jgi:hypothetical protein